MRSEQTDGVGEGVSQAAIKEMCFTYVKRHVEGFIGRISFLLMGSIYCHHQPLA